MAWRQTKTAHQLRFLMLAALTTGCGAGSQTSHRSPATAHPSSPEATRATAPREPASDARGSVAPSPHPLRDDRPPDPRRALPELTFRHFGMHIGGEANTPESKMRWFSDIESRTDAILRCYRFVDLPGSEGSLGLDFYVGPEGGNPEIRAVRQNMGAEALSECIRAAFSQITFHSPERPTVISYSLFFELGK